MWTLKSKSSGGRPAECRTLKPVSRSMVAAGPAAHVDGVDSRGGQGSLWVSWGSCRGLQQGTEPQADPGKPTEGPRAETRLDQFN